MKKAASPWLTFAVVVLAALLAACGGGGERGDGTPAATASPLPGARGQAAGGGLFEMMGLLLTGPLSLGGGAEATTSGGDDALLALVPGCSEVGRGWGEVMQGAIGTTTEGDGAPVVLAMRACSLPGGGEDEALAVLGVGDLRARGEGRAPGCSERELAHDTAFLAESLAQVGLGARVLKVECVPVGDGGIHVALRLDEGEGALRADMAMGARDGYVVVAAVYTPGGGTPPADAVALAQLVDKKVRAAR